MLRPRTASELQAAALCDTVDALEVDTVGSDVIVQLTQDELELTRKIFQRLDPEQKVTSRSQ